MSLVSNAIKRSHPEGPVTVTARREGGRVLVEVADDGPGLPEDRLEVVFEELRADPGRTEGSGLGLFLARNVMRAQHADVRLRNREGGGLVAIVDLPAAD